MSRSSEVQPRGARCGGPILIGMVALGCIAQALAYEPDQRANSVTIGVSGKKPVDESGSAGTSGRSSEEAPPALGRTPKAPPASLFRCWQEGRIIFEGRGYGALPPSQIAGELKANDGGTGRIQLLDMNRALCILELPK